MTKTRPPVSSISGYYSNLLPPPSKKRKYKQSYCQRLAEQLEYCDRNPDLRTSARRRKKLPPLLRLPAELRQQILFEVLDEGQILNMSRPNQTTSNIARTCQALAADVKQVMLLWDKKQNELREAHSAQREDFASYISDLMAPLHAASRVRPPVSRPRARHKHKNNNLRNRYVAHTKISSLYYEPVRLYGWEKSWRAELHKDCADEAAAVQMWKGLRKRSRATARTEAESLYAIGTFE